MRLSVSVDGLKISDPSIFPTPEKFEDAMGLIKSFVVEVKKTSHISQCIAGVPGVVTKSRDSLYFAPNLPDWQGKPLRDMLSEVSGAKVFLENDAALSGLGEAVYGAGSDFNIVTYLTISTGVGGARIVDKKIDRRVWGFEPGHQIVDMDDSKEEKLIELEDLVSGSGIRSRYGKKPEEIIDEKIWEEITKFLAIGIYNTELHWSSEVVVLGGGLIASDKITVGRLESYVSAINKSFPEFPKIKKATLGDYSGLYGALTYVNRAR